MLKSKTVNFEVNIKSDPSKTGGVHAMLAPGNGAEGYEIVFGGWRNTQSVLRDGKQKPNPGYSITRVIIDIIHK